MALEGSLQDMSLIDLFQIFRMGPKSGTLLLHGGSERGVVYVTEGQPIDAVVVCGVDRQVVAVGESAVLHLLKWDDATFVFRTDSNAARRPKRIDRDSEALVLEALRQRSEAALPLAYQRVTLHTRLIMASIPSSMAGGLSLDLDQWRLLSQVSTSRDVGELCEKTGMPTDTVIRLASELVAIGLVEAIQPLPPRSQVPPTRNRGREERAIGNEPEGGQKTTAERSLINAIMRRIRSL